MKKCVLALCLLLSWALGVQAETVGQGMDSAVFASGRSMGASGEDINAVQNAVQMTVPQEMMNVKMRVRVLFDQVTVKPPGVPVKNMPVVLYVTEGQAGMAVSENKMGRNSSGWAFAVLEGGFLFNTKPDFHLYAVNEYEDRKRIIGRMGSQLSL